MTAFLLIWAIVATAFVLALFSSLRESRDEVAAWKRTVDSHRERWGKTAIDRDAWKAQALEAEGNFTTHGGPLVKAEPISGGDADD